MDNWNYSTGDVYVADDDFMASIDEDYFMCGAKNIENYASGQTRAPGIIDKGMKWRTSLSNFSRPVLDEKSVIFFIFILLILCSLKVVADLKRRVDLLERLVGSFRRTPIMIS